MRVKRLVCSQLLAMAALVPALQAQNTVYQAQYGAGGTWNVYEVVRGNQQTWVDAEVAAKNTTESVSGLNKPGHLVTIHSAGEADFVQMIAEGASVWIGLTDNETYGGVETTSDAAGSSQVPPLVGKWVWVTGEPYSFARWNAGEPNDWENGNPGEDAIEMYNNGLFNDNGSGIGAETAPLRDWVIEYETQLANKLPGVSEKPDSIMPPNLPGVSPGPVGSWNIRMYRDSGFSACGLADPVYVILNNLGTTTDATWPVINHWDPESGICDAGNMLFANKVPFPGDIVGTAEDWAVMLAKTTISIPEAGDYTFGVQSDDSFGLRVQGGRFVSASGNGAVELQDSEVLYWSAGTCNASTRGVCRFDAPGNYVLEFIYFECTGNSDIELYWAKGAFQNNSDTCDWNLVGGPPTILPPDLPGVEPGAAGSWNIRVYRDSGFSSCELVDAVAVIQDNLGTTTDGTAYVINHWDPESGLCDAANLLFGNKIPFPGDIAGTAENNFVVLAKTTISVPEAGDYTFGVQSDDSFGLRVHGGHFGCVYGNGDFDPGDREVIFYSEGTCNANTRGVCHFDEAGQYVVEFVYYQCTGASDVELYWANGAFANNADTTTWQLVGNPGGVVPALPPGPLPGPAGCTDAFGIRAVRNVGAVPNLSTALEALSNPAATIVDTTSPVINFNDLDGSANNNGIFPGDLPLPGNQPGDDNDFVVVAKGLIKITEAGPYTFGVHSDDGFALRIRGQVWASKNGAGGIDVADPSTLVFAGGTGDSDTRAVVNLAVGEYDLELLWFENGGGAFAELYAVKGAFQCDSQTRDWRLVGYKAQTPPESRMGVTSDGWTVEYSAPGGANLNTIAEAETELEGAPSLGNVPRIQYMDPQAPGGASFACSLSFPQDTGADDEDFAIRATAQLVIPADGTYSFGFQGDDGGYLQIEEASWESIQDNADPDVAFINGDRLDFDANTGDSYTVGTTTLTAGTYTIRALFWERGGGGYFWVFGAAPNSPLKALGIAAPFDTNGLPLVCAPPRITSIKVNPDGTITIEWTGGGTLQYTGSLTPPVTWVDATGATSPYTFTPPAAVLFGRVQQ